MHGFDGLDVIGWIVLIASMAYGLGNIYLQHRKENPPQPKVEGEAEQVDGETTYVTTTMINNMFD